MNNSRKIAVDILVEVLHKNAYSNIALKNKLNKVDINDKDKSLVTEIVYGTLKYKYTIDKIIDNYLKNGINKIDRYILNILRMTIYQIMYLDKIPEFAAVNEAVELAKTKSKGASKLVNGVLRNLLRNKNAKYFDEDNQLDRLSFQYSFPIWMIKLFINQYGNIVGEKILDGLNSRPGVTVRVNNLQCSYEEAWEKLISNGYTIEEGSICPEAIKIINGKNIENNPLFKDGLITVQDESAMLVAPVMDLEDNMKVLDLCSAPGGKTTHISEIMNNSGQVRAYDIHEQKLSLIRQNTERLHIKNIILSVGDAAVYNSELDGFADRVLIDVPCSGLGIIKKKPEIKWTKDKKAINGIINIQKEIMNNASKYVKKGGILLYSTCTLNKNENDENVRWFIKNHPEYKIEPIFMGKMDNLIYSKEGTVTILPNDNMDGFFIAKFLKQW